MAQCKAKSSRSGEQCQRVAMPGATVCATHGGRAPQVQRAARRRLEEQELRRKLVDLLDDIDPTDTDLSAADVLEQALGRAHEMASLLGAIVHQLSPGFDASKLDESTRQALALWGPDHLGDGAPHVASEMLAKWNAQAAQLAKMALDAGIDERRAQLAERITEAQGQQLADVLRSVIETTRDFMAFAVAPELRQSFKRSFDVTAGRILEHDLARFGLIDGEAPALPAPPALLAPDPVATRAQRPPEDATDDGIKRSRTEVAESSQTFVWRREETAPEPPGERPRDKEPFIHRPRRER